MTQPRSQQINNLQTNYSRHQPPLPSPTVSVQSIQNDDAGPNDFYNQFSESTVTQIPGGADESSSAYLVGTGVEPFIGISVGNQFSVTLPGVNGGSPITVTIQSGDFVTLNSLSVLTASFVADRINTVLTGLGVPVQVASSNNGRLQLKSADGSDYTIGDDASVTISDITAGVVQKLGFGAVTTANATGVTAPKRGIITTSEDGRGGRVNIRYQSDGNLMTTKPTYMVSLGNRLNTLAESGNESIYARLTQVPGADIAGKTWKLSYFTTRNLHPNITTSKSKFTTLGAGDILRINIYSPSESINLNVDVDFSSGAPTSVQDVIDAINDAWYTATNGLGSGATIAIVSNDIPEPYQLITAGNDEDFYLVLNGNTPMQIMFSGETTAEGVAARINTLIASNGQSSEGSANAFIGASGLKYVEIRSASTDPNVSTVELRPGDVGTLSGQNLNGLNKLGFQVGIYKGSVIAKLSGGAEVTIFNPSIASTDNTLTLSNQSGTPLTKMGLSVTSAIVVEGEESVTPPDGLGTYSILIPEVMEFGEVPDGISKVVSEFANQNPSSAADPIFGIQNFNRYPGLDSHGKIPPSMMKTIMDFLALASIQLGSDISTANTSLTPRVLAPYAVGSGAYTLLWESVAAPAPSSATEGAFRIYIGGNERYIFTYNAKFTGSNWSKDVTAKVSAKLEFSGAAFAFYQKSSGAGVWADSAWTVIPLSLGTTGLSGLSWLLSLSSNAALASQSGPLKFTDPNLQVSSSLKFLPLTSNSASVGDGLLRILETPATSTEAPSLMRRFNAQWTVTVGDGTSSFGDFSGSDAIQQAIAFWDAAGIFSYIKILVKPGTYDVSTANGAIVIQETRGLSLEGANRDSCIIQVLNNVSPGIQIGQTGGGGESILQLKNLTILKSGAPFSEIDISVGSTLIAEDCSFQKVTITASDALAYYISRCYFENALVSADKPVIKMNMGDGSTAHGPFTMTDCEITAGQNNPFLLIKASGAAVPATFIQKITFERCNISLMSTTSTSSRLTGNCGLVDCNPLTSDINFGTGVSVHLIQFNNCNVKANYNGGAISILLHLQPQANGSAVGTGFMNINRFEINGGKWSAPASGTTYSPFMIVGVGELNPGPSAANIGAPKGGVFIKDLNLGFDFSATGFNMGTCTSDSTEWWTGDVADTITQSSWGAIAINANHIEILDSTIQNMAQGGGCGDIIIRWSELIIRDVFVDSYVLGGSSGVPLLRARFRPRMSGSTSLTKFASIHGLRMIGGTVTASDWASFGIIGLEPWVSATPPVADQQFEIKDCFIQSFKGPSAVPTAANGIILLAASSGSFYTGSPKNSSNLLVQGCHITNVLVGVFIGSAIGTQMFSKCRVRENTISECSGEGITIVGSAGSNADYVEIDRNVVTKCGQNVGFPGIYVGLNNASIKTVIITNNGVYNNNTSNSGTQIQFEIPIDLGFTVANDAPRGFIMGNYCNVSSTIGTIKLNAINGAANTKIALTTPATILQTQIRGVETEYDISVSGRKVFTNGDPMFHNYAVLATP